MSKTKNKIRVCELDELFEAIEANSASTTLFVIDENVEKHYQLQPKIESRLLKSAKRPLVWIAQAGEPTKKISEVEKCCEFFLSQNITRQSVLFTIGGGATSDFGGFIASLLLRGIAWNSVPTSLLSMVDAALGGKVGVNSSQAKNQIGAFHSPNEVYLCIDFLKTLPDAEMKSGNGEILKYCFLDKSISDLVLANKTQETILACLEFKQKIVELDPFEMHERKILNFGHTLGHCLERMYNLSHGISVAWGIFLILSIESNQDLLKKFEELTLKIGLDMKQPPWGEQKIDLLALETLLRLDKKMSTKDEIELILVPSLGEVVVQKRQVTRLLRQLEEFNHGLH